MFQQILSIVAPLFAIVAVGYFYGARVRPEMRITNQLIMDIFMPALIFHVMVQEDFAPGEYLMLMVGGLALMLGSGALAFLFARATGFAARAFVPPAMFSNWANLGLPLYVLALGQGALDGGIMLIVLGNILCFTLGVYIYSGQLSGWDVLKTPIIVAVILGLGLNAAQITLPTAIDLPIDMLGQVAIPLMLFSLGVRLTRVSWGESKAGLLMAIFCPLVGVSLALVLVSVLPMPQMHKDILVLFGVLPPAVINFMLAEQYNNNPDQVASMVIVGNLAAVVSIPMVLYFLLAGVA